MSTREIKVGAGLRFGISESNYEYAKKCAKATGITHFVGVLQEGTEVVGTDREVLRSLGCREIAWITPEGCAL